MTPLENIKNRLIDRILVTNNEQLLNAIDTIMSSAKIDETLVLNSFQREMLQMSESDIANGKLISEEDLRKTDSEWMD